MRPSRDPYTAPPAPRERGGPLLRFTIVLALLGAAAWAYLTFSEGRALTRSAEQAQELAQAGAIAAPALSTSMPETPPAPESVAPAPLSQTAPRASTVPPG